MSNTSKRNILLIGAALLLCGFLHVFLYGVDFFLEFSRLFCAAVTAAWGNSVLKRVTDRRQRSILLSIVSVFLLFLLLQTINYNYAQGLPYLRRYAWYGYYFCMMAFSVLMYELALSFLSNRRKPRGFIRWVLPVSGILLMIGVMSNDLHQLAFHFKGTEMLPESPKSYGLLFWLFFACFSALLLTAFITIIIRHRQIVRKNTFLALPPVLLLGVFLVLNMFDLTPRLCGIKLWQLGEMFTFCMLAFLEICIAIRVIPANTDYEKLFALSDLPAVILDEGGTVRYSSSECRYPFPDNENTLVMRHRISGGSIVWAVDVEPLNVLNRELAETAQRIDARNAYLSEEAKIKKEKAEAESRNRIYDEITRIVRPQLAQIGAMLEESGRSFDEKLPAISVLCAYIKRRSNMELLASQGTLPFDELSLAIRESLSYVRTLGVNTAVNVSGAGIYPANMLIAAYERVESVLETSLEEITDLMIFTKEESGEISTRMMIRAGALTLPPMDNKRGDSYSESISVTKDDQDMILSFVFREGGGEK